MKTFVLSGLCCAGLVALLADSGRAHGGQYRGPGDVVPPAPGGGGRSGGPAGPTTGGPAGPSAPAPSGPATGGPAGPTTGGPSGPGGGRGPTTGGRGAPIEDDLTTWSFWWEFNKDPFIRLKDAVQQAGPMTGSDDFFLGATRRGDAKDSLKPTREQVINDILPALKKAIDSTEQRDINSSCMVAMAKIGEDHPTEFKLIDVFTPRLKKADQEVRETAALSVGIAAIGSETELDLLVGLALDKEKGRAAAGGSVDYRTRAFALYGLGLTAYKTTKLETKKRAFEAMKEMLADERISDRNLKVAAINGMSVLNIGSSSEAEKSLLADAVKCLEDYYMKQLGSGEQLIQAHCPNAIAKLLHRDHERAEYYKDLFAADLQDKGKVKRSSNFVYASCAQALGMLARPYTDKDDKKCPDGKYSRLLLDVWKDHKDVQTRNFAVMSLGLIGGELNKEQLIKEFDKGGKNQEKPWCALALGVYSFFKYEADKKAGKGIEVESFIGDTLAKALKETKEPSLTGALAISLGLVQWKDAADEMRRRMIDNVAKEDMAGYLAIGLALMNDNRSIVDINNVVKQSVRRTELLQQAAVALGKLGDKTVATTLQGMMSEGEPNLAKLSAIASALGFIGDARTIEPLKKMLFDSQLQELSRAFAAVALGGVADKESLPWNSKFGTNINYRASVETLTNKQTGILDIL
jgi:HEAT repeat protein